MSSFFNDFLNEMNLANLQSQGELSIIEFANRIIFNNDSDFQLYPTQKAILKAFYNEPLDPEEKAILNQWCEEERSTWVEDRLRYVYGFSNSNLSDGTVSSTSKRNYLCCY